MPSTCKPIECTTGAADEGNFRSKFGAWLLRLVYWCGYLVLITSILPDYCSINITAVITIRIIIIIGILILVINLIITAEGSVRLTRFDSRLTRSCFRHGILASRGFRTLGFIRV